MRRFSILLLAFVSLGVSAQNIGEPRLHILDNGMRVITVENRSTPLVSAVWSAHVGDSAEPADFAGNSHYLEHLLLFRGTDKYPQNQIGEWSSGRGGYFNGYTWYDWTVFVLVMASSDLDGVLDRHEQMMFHGAFSGEDFETEKKAVFEELRSGLDIPSRYLGTSIPYHLYPTETFYSRSTIGTIETVQAATVERVSQYYKDYYVPSNMTLVVAGDFDTDDLLQRIEQRFGAYPAGDVPDSIYSPVPMKPGVNVLAEERAVGKAYFGLAVESPRANSPEWFPYQLLAEYLSGGKTSLLYSTLVTEERLLDDIEFDVWPRKYPGGYQYFYAETEPNRTARGIDAIWQALAAVGQSGVPADELKFARQRLLKAHWQALDDVQDVAESLAMMDAHGDYRLFADFEKRLNAVTAADVQAVARKYFTPSDFFVMALFPEGQTPADFSATVQANATGISRGTGAVASTNLPSGVTLLHDGKADASMESYTAAIRAGGRDGESAGVAEAVANMMIRETAQYSKTELQNLLDQHGFTLAATTTSDAAYIRLQAPAGNSDTAMALLVDVLTNPAFSDGEWTSTRAEMVAALESARDQPNAVAADLLRQTAFAGSPYGRSDADELASLSEFSARDLRAFWKQHYTTESMAVSYVGAVSSDQLAGGLEPLSGLKDKAAKREPISVAAIEGEVLAAEEMPGKRQDILYLAWHAPDIGSDDWVYWELAQRAIGGDLAGRLWSLRQDEGLAYSVWMFGAPRTDQPLTMMYMATAGEKRDAGLAALRREVDLLGSGLTQSELDRVKVSYLANLNRNDRTSERRSLTHAQWWIAGFDADRREKLTAIINAATLDEVNRVIGEVVDPDNYIFVEAGAIALNTPPE